MLERRCAAVRRWLIAVAVLVFAMVLLGGATRLTDSGLSITEWLPILGAIPPLSEAAWANAFTKYQTIPEYEYVNRGMSLDAFKTIYWWEWSHRFLGRAIGVIFFVPFIFFWLKGWIGQALTWRLAGTLALGGLQGLMGWYMVMSGFVDRVDVSQYRLAAHLAIAAAILAAIIWMVLDLRDARQARRDTSATQGIALSAAGLTGLIFVQIVAGAFVAGIDAGLAHNTWPLMDGKLIPSGLGAMQPWYANLFENALTVQFDHRIIAYMAVLWALLHWVAAARRAEPSAIVTGGAAFLAVAMLGQAALGVWTLLTAAPLTLALAHQAGAFVVFAMALIHLHHILAPARKSDYA